MPLSGDDRVLLMRHAKAGWNDISTRDHDRPLTSHGRLEAFQMVERFRSENMVPSRIIASSAQRALSTAQVISDELSGSELLVEPDLYLADPSTWKRLFKKYQSPQLTLWVGHNPGLEEWITRLTGEHVRMGTAFVAMLARASDSDASGDFRQNSGWQLVDIWEPEESR